MVLAGCLIALVGEARNAAGQTVRARLRTPEGYALTALTAFDAAKRVAAGEAWEHLVPASIRLRVREIYTPR